MLYSKIDTLKTLEKRMLVSIFIQVETSCIHERESLYNSLAKQSVKKESYDFRSPFTIYKMMTSII